MGHASKRVTGQLLWVGPRHLVSTVEASARCPESESSFAETPVEASRMRRAGAEADLLVLVPEDDIAAYRETCRNIKFDDRTHRLSVIFLLSPAHLDRAADLFDCGADDCVSLQAQPREIQLRLRNAVRAKLATDSM